MQRPTMVLLGLLLIAGLLECKTKSSSSPSSSPASTAVSTASAADAGLQSCAANLALAQMEAPPPVDSTQLATTSLNLTSYSPVSGVSLALLSIGVSKDASADFVWYQVCATGTKTCLTGIIDTPDTSSTTDVNMLLAYDGRLAAGNYTVTARSAIWKDREANPAVKKDQSYAGRPGHLFHWGAPISAQIVGFAGTPQPYRGYFNTQFKLSDQASTSAYQFQESLTVFKENNAVNPNLQTMVNNITNMRDIFGQLVTSPLLPAANNAAKTLNPSSLGLAGTSSDSCASVTTAVDAAIATTPVTTSAATAQAAQVAALSTPTATTPVASSTSTTTATAAPIGSFSTFDQAQMACQSQSNMSLGYTWAPVSSSFNGATYTDPTTTDGTTYGCVSPGTSIVSPSVVTASTPISTGTDTSVATEGGRNNALFGSGIGLLVVGSVVVVSSAAALKINSAKTNTMSFESVWKGYLQGEAKEGNTVLGAIKGIFSGHMSKSVLLLLASPAYALSSLKNNSIGTLKAASIVSNVSAEEIGEEGEKEPSTTKGGLLPNKRTSVVGILAGVLIVAGGAVAVPLSLNLSTDPNTQILTLASNANVQIQAITAQMDQVNSQIVSQIAKTLSQQ